MSVNQPISLETRFYIYDQLLYASSPHTLAYQNETLTSGDATIPFKGQLIPLKETCRQMILDSRKLFYWDLNYEHPQIRFQAFELLLSFSDIWPQIHDELRPMSQQITDELGDYMKHYDVFDMLQLAIELGMNPEDWVVK